VRHKANDGVAYAIRAGLSTILHCLQWYKLVLRIYTLLGLSTPAVHYPINAIAAFVTRALRSARAVNNTTHLIFITRVKFIDKHVVFGSFRYLRPPVTVDRLRSAFTV